MFENILSNETKNIFIFSHDAEASNLLNISEHTAWKVPNKEIKVNLSIIEELRTSHYVTVNNRLLEIDHKIELIVNYISYFLENIKIVPIIFGKTNNKDLKLFKEAIKKYWINKKNSFIVLSYYLARNTNLNKATKQMNYIKEIFDNKTLKNSNILDSYKVKKINPDNISALLLLYELSKETVYKNKTIKEIDKEYFLNENILIN